MQRNKLSIDDTRNIFFEDTALVGIVCPMPPHRFCWMVNKFFDLDFERNPDEHITQIRKNIHFHFPYFEFKPGEGHSLYRLYGLKCGKEPLLSDYKEFDFLWMIQSSFFADDAARIAAKLKTLPDIVLTHILYPDDIKSVNNLLV